MNGFFLCSAVALNLLSAPGGQVVGTVPLTNKFKSWMSVHFATTSSSANPARTVSALEVGSPMAAWDSAMANK